MRPPSLLLRLVLLQLGLAAVIIVAFACSAVWLSTRAIERAARADVFSSAMLVAQSLRREWHEDPDLARAAAAALPDNAPAGIRIDIFDAHGGLVLSTSRDRGLPPADSVWESKIHVDIGAIVVVSSPKRPTEKAVSALAMAMLVAAIPLFGLVLVLSRTLAARALRPLSRMTVQAERAPATEIATALGRPTDPSEVRALAGAFDRLLARLGESLRAEKHFAEDAAHELRTPITVLSGELEYVLADRSLSERQRHSLTHASDQVRQIADLVEALLLLRRVGPGRISAVQDPTPVDLGEVAHGVAEELVRRYPARASDLGVAAEDEVLVSGQATLIQSAVRNLVANAFKFTHPGQGIRVRVQARDAAALVVVEDGGPGVAAEDRERIFDPFFRGSEARAGLDGFGLGLPILRRVARAHGGDVSVDASPLGGARFELMLPAWAVEA